METMLFIRDDGTWNTFANGELSPTKPYVLLFHMYSNGYWNQRQMLYWGWSLEIFCDWILNLPVEMDGYLMIRGQIYENNLYAFNLWELLIQYTFLEESSACSWCFQIVMTIS